ncbi:unnamed protein product [Closterium sp. NIES-64]|nr:unnamed protein product [Closterium sp. NIES-64]
MAWIRWQILATLAVLFIAQSADAAGLIPGFPIPIPGVGTGVCTWDQFVGEMKKLQRTLAKNPIRYGGMAIALKQGLKKMQKNAPSELLPAVTILVPTNRALLAASLNPAFLIDLIQNKKKVQGIAKTVAAAVVSPGFPFPDVGCTWRQFVGDLKKLQRTLAKRPTRYDGMAIAMSKGLEYKEKDAPSKLPPAVTILVPTNRALVNASINPAILMQLIWKTKKVQDIAMVNVLFDNYDYVTLKAQPKGKGLPTADPKKKVVVYNPLIKGPRLVLGVLGGKSRTEIVNKDLFRGSCVAAHGTSSVLHP